MQLGMSLDSLLTELLYKVHQVCILRISGAKPSLFVGPRIGCARNYFASRLSRNARLYI